MASEEGGDRPCTGDLLHVQYITGNRCVTHISETCDRPPSTKKSTPTSQKLAIVRPLLKKSTLDPDEVSSYRPVSNLSFISKTVERVVAARFSKHIESNGLLPVHQSAYRQFHSTETAITALHNDLARAADADRVTAVVLLDLSSAFDTVDHQILLSVLQRRFGVDGAALAWFQSYLSDRTQRFLVGDNRSKTFTLDCSVPQGSVLGPLEFISYTEDVSHVFERHSVHHHIFADDMQGYIDTQLSSVDGACLRVHNCSTELCEWCASRRVQLNAAKTELAWFGKRSRLDSVATRSITIGSSIIQPSRVVRDLGVLFDSELGMKQHISKVTSCCFYQLRRLRQLRRLVGQELTTQLVHAFVLSKLDYGNAVLAGLPQSTLAPLQRVQNAAARLVLNLSPREHITPHLQRLHWLPVHLRIQFKLCLLMHAVHTNQSPTYLSDTVHAVASNPTRSGLRSENTANYRKPRCNGKIGERAFAFSGPSAWNRLTSELHNISDRSKFKKHLKTYFFKLAFQ